jgi:hypothetical protein
LHVLGLDHIEYTHAVKLDAPIANVGGGAIDVRRIADEVVVAFECFLNNERRRHLRRGGILAAEESCNRSVEMLRASKLNLRRGRVIHVGVLVEYCVAATLRRLLVIKVMTPDSVASVFGVAHEDAFVGADVQRAERSLLLCNVRGAEWNA